MLIQSHTHKLASADGDSTEHYQGPSQCVVIASCINLQHAGRPRQAALETQNLSCMYLTHHELESVTMMTIIIIIMLAACS